jgi:hypothetical protein
MCTCSRSCCRRQILSPPPARIQGCGSFLCGGAARIDGSNYLSNSRAQRAVLCWSAGMPFDYRAAASCVRYVLRTCVLHV